MATKASPAALAISSVFTSAALAILLAPEVVLPAFTAKTRLTFLSSSFSGVLFLVAALLCSPGSPLALAVGLFAAGATPLAYAWRRAGGAVADIPQAQIAYGAAFFALALIVAAFPPSSASELPAPRAAKRDAAPAAVADAKKADDSAADADVKEAKPRKPRARSASNAKK